METTILSPSPGGKIDPGRMRTVVRSVHIAPAKKGGWTVLQSGKEKVEAHFQTQREAIEYGREVSLRKGNREMFIHGRNGRVREVRTYGGSLDARRALADR